MFQNSVIYTLTDQKVITHKPLANKRRSFVVIPAPFCHILLFATKDEGGRTDHVTASDWVMSPWLRPSFLLSVSWSFFLLIHFFFKSQSFLKSWMLTNLQRNHLFNFHVQESSSFSA